MDPAASRGVWTSGTVAVALDAGRWSVPTAASGPTPPYDSCPPGLRMPPGGTQRFRHSGNGATDGFDAECGRDSARRRAPRRTSRGAWEGPPGWWHPVSGFTAALSLLGLALLAVAGAYGAAWALRLSSGPLPAQPFGSGLEPTEHAVSRFHMRWYTVTMLFLAFDMEMVFMYPWTLVISAMGPSAVIEMFVFLAVLLTGVIYAWREGALRWA